MKEESLCKKLHMTSIITSPIFKFNFINFAYFAKEIEKFIAKYSLLNNWILLVKLF